jgi:LysR family cys regulon transcriptional activator
VELGLGVGIMADMAYNPERDKGLRSLPVGHLFGTNVTRIALKHGAYLRSYIYALVELLSPETDRKLLDQALKGGTDRYEI